jgi:hypothetical protein
MRLLIALSVVTLFSGCAQNFTVSRYQSTAANPARIELRAHDKFRNTDRLTLSIETRGSCQQKPDLATIAELHTERDLLFRDRSVYSTSGFVAPGKPHLLHLWNVSSDSAMTSSCINTGVWEFEPGKNYILEIRNWSSRGGTGKEFFGKFGCEWSMTDAETTLPVPQTKLTDFPVCGDEKK